MELYYCDDERPSIDISKISEEINKEQTYIHRYNSLNEDIICYWKNKNTVSMVSGPPGGFFFLKSIQNISNSTVSLFLNDLKFPIECGVTEVFDLHMLPLTFTSKGIEFDLNLGYVDVNDALRIVKEAYMSSCVDDSKIALNIVEEFISGSCGLCEDNHSHSYDYDFIEGSRLDRTTPPFFTKELEGEDSESINLKYHIRSLKKILNIELQQIECPDGMVGCCVHHSKRTLSLPQDYLHIYQDLKRVNFETVKCEWTKFFLEKKERLSELFVNDYKHLHLQCEGCDTVNNKILMPVNKIGEDVFEVKGGMRYIEVDGNSFVIWRDFLIHGGSICKNPI